MAVEPADILVELSFVFGAEAGSRGCRLGEGAAARMREVFGRTVAPALEREPDVWTAEARRYVVKQVVRIGREASRVAIRTGSSEITAEILALAAYDVIIAQQLVRDRARTLKWAPPILGASPFCMGW